MSEYNFLVLGAGSWGTAVAVHLRERGHQVTLWGRDASHVQTLQRTRQNSRYLPEVTLPQNLEYATLLAEALQLASYVIIAVPSSAFYDILKEIKINVKALKGIVWLTKGLDPKTGDYLSELAVKVLGDQMSMALLTGPSFASEVAKGQPTAVVVASKNKSFALTMQDAFHAPFFRIYYCADLHGAELGGAIKNIIAIAVGVSDGLKCGANARAALMTRGLAEMRRLGAALHVEDQTLSGLSGMGDLVLTCTDDQSRNRRFGLLIGQGFTLEEAKTKINQSIEGYFSVQTVYQKARESELVMPITFQVYRILYENMPPSLALEELLARDVGTEE